MLSSHIRKEDTLNSADQCPEAELSYITFLTNSLLDTSGTFYMANMSFLRHPVQPPWPEFCLMLIHTLPLETSGSLLSWLELFYIPFPRTDSTVNKSDLLENQPPVRKRFLKKSAHMPLLLKVDPQDQDRSILRQCSVTLSASVTADPQGCAEIKARNNGQNICFCPNSFLPSNRLGMFCLKSRKPIASA